MKPILFQFGFFTIYTYGLFIALAFLVSTWLLTVEAGRRRVEENRIYNLCLVSLVSGLSGARLFYCLLNWDYFKANPLEIVMLQHGGLVWFGGLAGAILGSLSFMRLNKMPLLDTLDLFAPYTALAQAIGRIGCFFNGCCHGRESAWGFYFPVHEKILFPSQLIDAAGLLVIFVILRLDSTRRSRGLTLCLYLMLAAVQRFLMEFIRGDDRLFYFSLSVFQWISAGLFLIALFLFALWKRRPV